MFSHKRTHVFLERLNFYKTSTVLLHNKFVSLDKIDCTSELKVENHVFTLYFTRFALSLTSH